MKGGCMLTIRQMKTSRIREFGHDEFVETMVVMPSIRPALAQRAARIMAGRTRKNGLLVIAEDDCRMGFIPTANMVHARTRSTYVAYVAQDAYAGFFWLEYAVRAMEEQNAGLVPFNEGKFFGTMAAFGLVRREWTREVYGGDVLFYPRYTRYYGDVELTDIARETGKLAYTPHSLVVEVDYGRFLPDETEGKSASRDDPDGVLYVQRAITGFDGKTVPFLPTFGPVTSVLVSIVRESPAQENAPKDDGPRDSAATGGADNM